MTLDLTLVVPILVIGTVAAAAVVADRNARINAWRQIALERRWNNEQRNAMPRDYEGHVGPNEYKT